MSLGEYGNWIPKGAEVNEERKYSVEETGRAMVLIQMEAHPKIMESLNIIDNAMEKYLEEIGQQSKTYNRMIRKDPITIRYPLVCEEKEEFERFPNHMDIQEYITLGNDCMINSEGMLINNQGDEISKMLFKLSSGDRGLPDNSGGMLCLENATFYMASNKSKLLIRKSYLQLIKAIEKGVTQDNIQKLMESWVRYHELFSINTKRHLVSILLIRRSTRGFIS